MYPIILKIHSYIAFVLLASLLFSIIYILVGNVSNKPFSKKHRVFAMIGLEATHLQLLFGLILYFLSPMGFSSISSQAMEYAELRLYILEHPVTMILALTLITIGYSKAKRATTDKKKYRFILIFYTIGLLLILSRIPWQVWP